MSTAKERRGSWEQIAIGAKGVYAWGSDEVGQLGLGESTALKAEQQKLVFRFVSPVLKTKVTARSARGVTGAS